MKSDAYGAKANTTNIGYVDFWQKNEPMTAKVAVQGEDGKYSLVETVRGTDYNNKTLTHLLMDCLGTGHSKKACVIQVTGQNDRTCDFYNNFAAGWVVKDKQWSEGSQFMSLLRMLKDVVFKMLHLTDMTLETMQVYSQIIDLGVAFGKTLPESEMKFGRLTYGAGVPDDVLESALASAILGTATIERLLQLFTVGLQRAWTRQKGRIGQIDYEIVAGATYGLLLTVAIKFLNEGNLFMDSLALAKDSVINSKTQFDQNTTDLDTANLDDSEPPPYDSVSIQSLYDGFKYESARYVYCLLSCLTDPEMAKGFLPDVLAAMVYHQKGHEVDGTIRVTRTFTFADGSVLAPCNLPDGWKTNGLTMSGPTLKSRNINDFCVLIVEHSSDLRNWEIKMDIVPSTDLSTQQGNGSRVLLRNFRPGQQINANGWKKRGGPSLSMAQGGSYSNPRGGAPTPVQNCPPLTGTYELTLKGTDTNVDVIVGSWTNTLKLETEGGFEVYFKSAELRNIRYTEIINELVAEPGTAAIRPVPAGPVPVSAGTRLMEQLFS
jgi:hypothetical protein